MFTLFGRKYARNDREVVETLFGPGGTACGTYRPRGNGVVLYDLRGAPRVFVRPDGLAVSCSRDQRTRRIRYQYGLCSTDSAWIGAPASYSEQCEGVVSAFRNP